jgi:hypothetical protein
VGESIRSLRRTSNDQLGREVMARRVGIEAINGLAGSIEGEKKSSGEVAQV